MDGLSIRNFLIEQSADTAAPRCVWAIACSPAAAQFFPQDYSSRESRHECECASPLERAFIMFPVSWGIRLAAGEMMLRQEHDSRT